MAVNKVVVNDETVLDLTADTVDPTNMLSGVRAHMSNGEQATGRIATYSGATSVTPGTSAQTLQTAGKYLASDITVGAAAAASTEPDVKAVTFWDYDGTIAASWTAEEAGNAVELPTPPAHEGLVFDGWNWALDEIKAADGFVDVGALYTTDDGKTRIHINFDKSTWDEFKINFWQSNINAVTFDWGDGSGTETVAANSWQTITHAYAASGRYTITMSVAAAKTARLGNGLLGETAFAALNDTDVYRASMVEAIEIGERMSLTEIALIWCTSLRTLTIPSGASVGLWRTFERCTNLRGLSLPANITGTWNQAFYYCRSLRALCLPLAPENLITGNIPFNQSPITRLRIPDGNTDIVGSACQNCVALRQVVLPDTVTLVKANAFDGCFALEEITGLDNVTVIDSYAFSSCYSLRRVDGLGSVTTIGAQAFRNCFTVRYYDFSGATAVPLLSNANAFTGMRDDCEIRVPSALLNAWSGASNWSTYYDHIVGV